jgi:hypothetical protein
MGQPQGWVLTFRPSGGGVDTVRTYRAESNRDDILTVD